MLGSSLLSYEAVHWEEGEEHSDLGQRVALVGGKSLAEGVGIADGLCVGDGTAL